jgi:hypothetical protein
VTTPHFESPTLTQQPHSRSRRCEGGTTEANERKRAAEPDSLAEDSNRGSLGYLRGGATATPMKMPTTRPTNPATTLLASPAWLAAMVAIPLPAWR